MRRLPALLLLGLLANPTDAGVELVLLDRRSGEVTRRERFALPIAPFAWPPSPSDVVIQGDRVPVLLFGPNVTNETSPCRFRIEPDRIVAEPCVAFATLWVAPCAAGIVIQNGEDTVAIGEGGRELWRLADWKLVDVSGVVLVRRGPVLRAVDPSSGAVILERTDAALDGHWWGGSSSGPCFVLGRSELDEKSPVARYDLVLVALDRRTLEVRWRQHHLGYAGLASTADLTIVATHPRTEDTATVITALDAASGAERWRFEAPRASGSMTPVLSAGHMLLCGHGTDPLLIVPLAV
jgi:hypothetical protein